MFRTIDRRTLQDRMAANSRLVILEALGERYWREAHLPGALLFPHDQVDRLAPALLPDKDAEIVVYCANKACQNSKVAAHRLSALGYTNVAAYEDGKADWIEAGLPVERAEATSTA